MFTTWAMIRHELGMPLRTAKLLLFFFSYKLPLPTNKGGLQFFSEKNTPIVRVSYVILLLFFHQPCQHPQISLILSQNFVLFTLLSLTLILSLKLVKALNISNSQPSQWFPLQSDSTFKSKEFLLACKVDVLIYFLNFDN